MLMVLIPRVQKMCAVKQDCVLLERNLFEIAVSYQVKSKSQELESKLALQTILNFAFEVKVQLS